VLIWLRHVLDAEVETRMVRRVAVRYSDLLADPLAGTRRLSRALADIWPARPDARLDPGAVLRSELRHHDWQRQAIDVSPPLHQWLDRTWRAFGALVDEDAPRLPAALVELDAIRAEFDALCATLGEHERLLVQARHRAACADVQMAALRAHVTQMEAERARLESAVDALRAHRSAVDAERVALLTSMSWRVTAPLRAFGRMVRWPQVRERS
jgi:hypothetical protein